MDLRRSSFLANLCLVALLACWCVCADAAATAAGRQQTNRTAEPAAVAVASSVPDVRPQRILNETERPLVVSDGNSSTSSRGSRQFGGGGFGFEDPQLLEDPRGSYLPPSRRRRRRPTSSYASVVANLPPQTYFAVPAPYPLPLPVPIVLVPAAAVAGAGGAPPPPPPPPAGGGRRRPVVILLANATTTTTTSTTTTTTTTTTPRPPGQRILAAAADTQPKTWEQERQSAAGSVYAPGPAPPQPPPPAYGAAVPTPPQHQPVYPQAPSRLASRAFQKILAYLQ